MAGNWRNWNAAYESSIQMKADGSGIILKMGGDGTIFYDFERLRRAGRRRGGEPARKRAPGHGVRLRLRLDVRRRDGERREGHLRDAAGGPGRRILLALQDAGPVNPDAPHVETRTSTRFRAGPCSGTTGSTCCSGCPTRTAPTRTGTASTGSRDCAYATVVVICSRLPRPTTPALRVCLTLPTTRGGADWKPLETRRAQRIDRGRPSEELGVYNVYLSNYAGHGRRRAPLPLLCRLWPVQLPGLLDQGE